jgi:O-antigen/teichoic acid export membrane protein
MTFPTEHMNSSLVKLNQVIDRIKILAGLKPKIVLNATGTLMLKIAFSGLMFLTSLILARLLGVKGYGAYAYAIAWINLLKIFGILGLEQLIIREAASYCQRSEWNFLKGLLNWVRVVSLLASLLLATSALVLTWLISGNFNSQMLTAFWIALIMLPIVVQMRVRQAALQGLQHIIAGQLPEMLIQPASFLLLIAFTFLIFQIKITSFTALALQVIAASIAFFTSSVQLKQRIPQPVKHISQKYQSGIWMRSALPLLFISGIHIINARMDSIMLGILSNAESVGIYVASARVAELILFVSVAGGTAIAPRIAELHAAGELDKLQHLITKMSRVMLLFALPVAAGLLIFSNWILYLFGPEFIQGRLCITILCFAQLINVAFGPVNLLLIMCGQERQAAKAVLIGASINFILNLILIPIWGLEGTAAATTTAIVIINSFLSLTAYKRLGIYSSATGKMGFLKKMKI